MILVVANEFEVMWTEACGAKFKVLSLHMPRGIEVTKNDAQNSQCLRRGSNREIT
jgi:hypothetical protein